MHVRKITLIGFLLAALFMTACGDKATNQKPRKLPQPFIFHPFLFQEEMHTQLHVPYWFNDSIVGSSGIRQIIRLTYAGLENDPDRPGNRETFPKLKTIYTFSPEGRLIMLEEIYFADGLEISRKAYSIDESSDNLILGVHVQEESTASLPDETEGFVLFRKIDFNRNVIDLAELKDSRRHIFILDKKYWGGLSVDSVAHPGYRDWVILGSPQKPLKRYQVKNTVTESNVSRYTYIKSNYPKTISWNDYPFSQRRSFHYNREGIFSGFTDSTFMDHSYITRTITTFSINKMGFPVKVIRKSNQAENNAGFSAVEVFKYINFTETP